MSFASKFAHFFIGAERVPIYDSYADQMLSLHLVPSTGARLGVSLRDLRRRSRKAQA